MKKILTFFLSLTVVTGLFAQTADDAVGLAQEFYEGTARTMAMGNAFTALGGDLGAIGINPASSGVLGCSQISFTPSLSITRSAVSYLGNSLNTSNTGLTVSNFGGVITFDTGNYAGLVNYSFGFVYNKKNNFRSKMRAAGKTDQSSMLGQIASRLNLLDNQGWWTDISKEALESDNAYANLSSEFWPDILAWKAYALAPFYTDDKEDNYIYIASTENNFKSYDASGKLIQDSIATGGTLNQGFNRRTFGSNDEFAFNFGANISDRIYVGANLNLHTVNQTTEEYYEEKAVDSRDFDDGFASMDNSFWLRTSGAGFNVKLGIIAAPVAGLRLGATISTPTWYSLTDQWDYTMNTAFNNGKSYTEYSPTGRWDYRLTAPMRWSVGAAYTFWGRGLVSIDYEQVNYARTKLRLPGGSYGNYGDYATENAIIAADYRNASILRVGAEIRVVDFLSLRGGFQRYWPAAKGATNRLDVYSAGIGFNLGERTCLDLSWRMTRSCTDDFMLYGNYLNYSYEANSSDNYITVLSPKGTNRHSKSLIACTFSFKF